MSMRPYEAHILPPDEQGVAHIPLTEGSDIGSGLSRHSTLLRELAEHYTGEPNGEHSPEREFELFKQISTAEEAKRSIEEIDAQIIAAEDPAAMELLIAKKQRAAQAVRMGGQAVKEVVEVSARFAHFMARASVGMPVKNRTQTVKANARATAHGGRTGPKTVGTYSDIANLATPYAELEDRMQSGVEGLLMAMRKYNAKAPEENSRNQAKFITYAAWWIQNKIQRNMAAPDTTESCGPRYHQHRRDEEYLGNLKKYNVTNLNEVTHECQGKRCGGCHEYQMLQQIQQWNDAQYQIPLDEVTFPYAATEEVWDTGDEPPVLNIADVWSSGEYDEGTDNVQTESSADAIEDVLRSFSEREAGVIRLRYGLTNGEEHTLDEIGNHYAIAKERVRQILTKTMTKLRASTDIATLKSYHENLGDTVANFSTIHDAERVRTTRMRAVKKYLPPQEEQGTQKQSWQLEPNEDWDTDIRPAARQEKGSAEYERTYAVFEKILLQSSLHHFQFSFAKSVRSPYPKALFDQIESAVGSSLTPQHLEQFWNRTLPKLIGARRNKLGEDLDTDRIGQLFSALLRERMRDTDSISLVMPYESIGYIGAWAKQGEIKIFGNAGDHVGFSMSGTARLTVRGDVGDYAARKASGYAQLEVTGNAGRYLAQQASGNTNVVVAGKAKRWAAENLRQEAEVQVGGNVFRAVQKPLKIGWSEITPVPESQPEEEPRLGLAEVCTTLGVNAQQLERYMEACGCEGQASLSNEELEVFRELFPELGVPKVPEEGYTSMEGAVLLLGYRGTPKQFEREIRSLGFDILQFRDENNTIKPFIPTSSLPS